MILLVYFLEWLGEFLGAAPSHEPILSALGDRLVRSIGGMIIDGGK
jgi:hypothetical protein